MDSHADACARAQTIGVYSISASGLALSVFQLCALRVSALNKTYLSAGRQECGPYHHSVPYVPYVAYVPLCRPRDHEPFQPALRGNPQQAAFVYFRVGGSPAFVTLRVCGKPKAETTRRGTAKVVWLTLPLQAIVLALDLQAARRRGVSRGEAVSQTRRVSWWRVSASRSPEARFMPPLVLVCGRRRFRRRSFGSVVKEQRPCGLEGRSGFRLRMPPHI